eukprot:Seg2885.2 transcript_id=Seg2885.2/GoldUCD/mRNA.D3Y31 product="hypothetical protein" protein_id=Seg2885.2/GoldUCD/D3Y31
MKCLVIFGIVICLVQLSKSAKVEPVTTNIGGGECIDPEDCSNNGVCNFSGGEKGQCNCAVNFSGANCEASKKMDLGEEANSKPATTRETLRKRGSIRRYKTGIKRTLEYDTGSDVLGLTPETLVAENQPFLLFNPDKKDFVFVSKDLKITGKHNAYVQARSDRLGLRNQFTLNKVGDKYTIFNTDQRKYIYVSSSKSGFIKSWNNNVLAADAVPDDVTQKAKFLFEFEDSDGDGFYTIKNQDKYLYVSMQHYGIPLRNMVKATNQREVERWDSRFFQFALREKAKKIELEVSEEPKQKIDLMTIVDNQQSKRVCNQGDPNKDKAITMRFEYKEDFVETKTFTKTHGFTFNGNLKATFGGVSFQYANTQTSTETQTSTKSSTNSFEQTIEVNKCLCVTITYQHSEYTQNFLIKATTKDNKVLKAKGAIDGQKQYDFRGNFKYFPWVDGFKCPYEST